MQMGKSFETKLLSPFIQDKYENETAEWLDVCLGVSSFKEFGRKREFCQ